jgi:L-rhamnose mutarotase
MSRRFCFTLDLKGDPARIAEHRKCHEKTWREITQALKNSEDLEIYLFGTRMFMTIEANQNFSLEQKAGADEQDTKVQAWEQLIWRFQQVLPETKPGKKLSN